MKNKNDYFIDGVKKFIRGYYFANKTLEVFGSWQHKSYVHGFNSLSELFSTVPAYHQYCAKVHKNVDRDIRWLQLSITKDGKDYELSFPHILCPVKNLRAILTENGFTCNELI